MKKLKDIIKYKEPIMIFGVGKNGMRLEGEIAGYGKNVKYYVVSSKENNPDYFQGTEVKTIAEIKEFEKDGVIIISNSLSRQIEIYEMLKKCGFKNILHGICSYNFLSEKEKKYYYNRGWRVNMMHEKKLGEWKCRVSKQDILIYIVTSHLNQHQSNLKIQSELVQYIQAGSILTEAKICDLQDDSGINISQKNPYYCELTAGYWIYKNDNVHKYVGLYHYSRMLDLDDAGLMQAFESGIDVILSEPLSHFVVRKKFDWVSDSNLRKAVENMCPDYLETYDRYSADGLLVPSNMFVGKKDIFNQYYEWMMRIFEEYEKILTNKHMKLLPRCIGYMAEDLTGVFFLHHAKEWQILYVEQKKLYM